jgi:hypothetical protein
MKHLTFLCLAVLAVSQLFAEDGFVSLTKEFKTKVGGESTFTIEGDTIIGKRGNGPNTFLCTDKKYSNFILTFDVKYEVECNSGVQFRSGIGTDKNGKGYLFGYQCEIVPENDTANVYDEHNRNRYLVPQETLKDQINKATKKGDWNSIKIQCVGSSIKTWLNGEKIVDIIDIEANEGVFGLQVHSGDKGIVLWRNIQIKELPETPWVSLYSDKKLSDLVEKRPTGEWTILDDGTLCGRTPPGEPRDGIIVTKTTYKDFALKVSFKMEHGNSGLYFRAKDNDKPHWLSGFQCEIAENDAVNAAFWEVDGRGWIQKTKESDERSRKATKRDKDKKADWNTIATVAVGEHLVSFLNGWKIMDINDPTPKHGFEGKVGLQLHGGGNQGCLFRDFYVMPLDEAAVKLMKE